MMRKSNSACYGLSYLGLSPKTWIRSHSSAISPFKNKKSSRSKQNTLWNQLDPKIEPNSWNCDSHLHDNRSEVSRHRWYPILAMLVLGRHRLHRMPGRQGCNTARFLLIGVHLCSQPHLYHNFPQKNFAHAESSSIMNAIADVGNDCIAKDIPILLLLDISNSPALLLYLHCHNQVPRRLPLSTELADGNSAAML